MSDMTRRELVKKLRTILIYLGAAGFCWMALAQVSQGGQTRQVNPDPDQGSASRPTDKSSEKAGGSGTPTEPIKAATYDLALYVIGADDQLMISVWREPELSMSVLVRPDGMITLPLVNDVKVAGLKPPELQSLLVAKLKPFVNEPQVTVVVQGIRSRKVFLAGQGAKAGAFPLSGRMTALELIVQSGGLGPFAKVKSIYVLRTVNGQQTRIHFNYKDAMSGKSSSDVVLEPGDILVVP
jgi:polysaccharide export outer membrane protein